MGLREALDGGLQRLIKAERGEKKLRLFKSRVDDRSEAQLIITTAAMVTLNGRPILWNRGGLMRWQQSIERIVIGPRLSKESPLKYISGARKISEYEKKRGEEKKGDLPKRIKKFALIGLKI